MAAPSFVIRRATDYDVAALGELGAMLIQTHYDFDPRRFMAPRPHAEQGYAAFLRSQIHDEDAVVLVAESSEGRVLGYVYAGLEPASWQQLREAAGFIHDVIVHADGRGGGVATALLEAAIDWLRAHGAPRVVLWTAESNTGAQRLFGRLGFRPTMIEMTREL